MSTAASAFQPIQMAPTQTPTTKLSLSSQRFFSRQLEGDIHIFTTNDNVKTTTTTNRNNNNKMDIVFRVSPDEDILSVYFKKLGDCSIKYTKPATRNGDFLLDYDADGFIVKAEFMWISERAKCHFFNEPVHVIDGLSPFILNTSMTNDNSTLQIFFVNVEEQQLVTFVPSQVKGVGELLGVGDVLIGFQVELNVIFQSK